MDCHHGHHHLHHHHHHEGLAEGISKDNLRRLKNVLFISIAYLLLQLLGGYASGSLALLAEAGHKFSDMVGIALALLAAWLATKPMTNHRTFGFGRAEILVAFGNGMVLIAVAAEILMEAYERMQGDGHVHEINGPVMLGIACAGLLLNLWSLGILKPSQDKNLNIRGAYLHVMTDLVGSLGALVSSVLIWLKDLVWLDWVLSGVIAILVLSNAVRILAASIHVLLEAAPRGLDLDKIEHEMLSLPGVVGIHDLHVWTITTGKDALLVHAEVDKNSFNYGTAKGLEHQLRERFGFCHITVQLEPEGFQEPALPF